MNIQYHGSWIKYIGHTFLQYDGNAKYLILYIVALLLIFIGKNKWSKRLFLYPAVILFATIFNPLVVRILIGLLDISERYYRFIWLLPMAIVISFVAVELISRVRDRKKYIALVCVFIVVLVFCGNIGTRYKNYKVLDNKYKVSVDIIQISQILHRDTKKENPLVAYSNILMVEYRTYDPSVISLFGREDAISDIDLSKEHMQECIQKQDYKSLLYAVVTCGYRLPYDVLDQTIENSNIDYLIINKSLMTQDYFCQDDKIMEVSRSQNYIVYRIDK